MNKELVGLKKEVVIIVKDLNNPLPIVTRAGIPMSKEIRDFNNISYALNMICFPGSQTRVVQRGNQTMRVGPNCRFNTIFNKVPKTYF